MADARPRPRPRPRPVQKTGNSSSYAEAANSPQGISPSASRSNSAIGSVAVVQDTDDMFIRNRNRSSRTWQKLEQMNKEIEKRNEDHPTDSDDGGEVLTPRRRYKRPKEGSVVPAWQRSKDLARLLSEEMSNPSDDDVIEVTGEACTPTRKQNANRKRMRSRSRSITPPPALPVHQILHAKQIVRQTLEAAGRPPSPTVMDLDDPGDVMILQPEFMALAQRIREESKNRSRPANTGKKEELLLNIRWKPHPLSPDEKEETWQYKIDNTDTFRDLFEAVAEDAQVPSSTNIILTYQGKRIFPSVTPQTIQIWSDMAEFDAYEKKAYDYIQAHLPNPIDLDPLGYSTTTTGASNGPIFIDSDEDTSDPDFSAPMPTNIGQSQESEAELEVDRGETMKLVLRSSLTNDITLVVRPTTKCGAVVKAFLKKAGKEAEYPHLFENGGAVSDKGKGKGKRPRKSAPGLGKDPQLSIDGDKLSNDASIGETDLEDGDMVEVIGL